jgi:aspartate/methionine/tyrosine aminotransferase
MFSRRLCWTAAENPLAALERERRSVGAGLLDLTVTNPTQVGLPYPDEALAAALSDPAIGRYDPSPLGPLAARVAVAAEYARLGAEVSPTAVALTASSSESYALLFKLLCDPGDVVLVPQPSYPLVDDLARLEGVKPRPYRLAFDGQWHIDSGSLDLQGARALVVVSPNNPTGSFLRRSDLARLAALAAERDLALICDEVFADYSLSPAADAVRTVAAEPLAGALAFCLGGLSKSCGLPQMKLGWITAVGSPAVVAAALARLELALDTYLSVGTPVARALPRLLSLGGDIRRAIADRVSANRAGIAAALGPASPCTLLPAEGGWTAILRVPAVLSDEDWALTLLASDDVLVQPGYFFDLTGLGATLVLSLLTPPADLVEGVRRLLARVAVQLRT